MRVLVTGPESSGTRMMTRMLHEAGAVTLHRPMPMSMPGIEVPGTFDLAYPHGLWTDFAGLEWDAAVVMARHPAWTARAQLGAGHLPEGADAGQRMRAAWSNIVAQLDALPRPWWVVPYESLAVSAAVEALCVLLGLDGSQVVTRWQDANAKYHGGPAWGHNEALDEKAMWRARG